MQPSSHTRFVSSLNGDAEGSEVGDGDEWVTEEGRPQLQAGWDGAQCYEGQGPELRGSVMNAEMKP